MIDRHWRLYQIKTRAKELLEEHPRKQVTSFNMMIRDVIAVRREMNRIKRSRYL